MKRVTVLCLVITSLAAIFVTGADAAQRRPKKVAREATAGYDNPTLGIASGTGGHACFPCPTFDISAKETFVRMEIEDDASPGPVAFEIKQRWPGGSCCADVAGPFCGSTGKQRVKIAPNRDVLVYVFAAGDVVCPGAVATSGRARAVFSNVP